MRRNHASMQCHESIFQMNNNNKVNITLPEHLHFIYMYITAGSFEGEYMYNHDDLLPSVCKNKISHKPYILYTSPMIILSERPDCLQALVVFLLSLTHLCVHRIWQMASYSKNSFIWSLLNFTLTAQRTLLTNIVRSWRTWWGITRQPPICPP